MKILGLTVLTHDTAACIVENGKVLVAIEEERLSGLKHSKDFPIRSIKYCLHALDISISQIGQVAICLDATLMLQKRYLRKKHSHAYNQDSIDKLLNQLDDLPNTLSAIGCAAPITFVPHYRAHHTSGIWGSGFDEACLLSIDGHGEHTSGEIAIYSKDGVSTSLKSIPVEDSLGLFYASFTAFAGLRPLSDEGTLMGLSALGDRHAYIPGQHMLTYEEFFRELLIPVENSFWKVNRDYFTFGMHAKTWFTEKLTSILGQPNFDRSRDVEDFANLANAVQHSVENCICNAFKTAAHLTKLNNLIYTGGVALNCVATGKAEATNVFQRVHVPFAPGDNGPCIGAALSISSSNARYYNIGLEEYTPFLGISYTSSHLQEAIATVPETCSVFSNDDFDIYIKAATLLCNGFIGAISSGRSEFGPRALGNRSIVADPRRSEMKHTLNSRVKFREGFRPFAPAVLAEHASTYFSLSGASEYMTRTYQATSQGCIDLAATIHDNNTGRLQMVTQKNSPNLHLLIHHFYALSGIPALINTSFNVKGQPIVESPEEAVKTFLMTDIDFLILENFLILKSGIA